MEEAYLITINRRKLGKNYTPLENAIKSFSAWANYMPNCWIIKTDSVPQQIYLKLSPFLDELDQIYIIQVTGQYYGTLPSHFWEWMSTHISE